MDSSSALVGASETARRRRLAVGLVTSGAAALLLAACGAGQIPAPEASSTSSPSAAEEAPTPSTTPTPTPTASPTWSADLTACGLPMDAPTTEGLWVGNYGGGIGVPAAAPLAAPLGVPLSVIIAQDLGGRQIAVNPLQAYLVGTVPNEEPGPVVAVVGAPLPAAVSTLMGSGSEGDGGGSEGQVVLPLTFTGCAESLAPGWYGVVVEVEVSGAGPTMTTWAYVPVLVEG